MGCSRAWRRAGGSIIVLLMLVSGCGGSADGESSTSRVLKTSEAKQLLQQLPYHYEFRHTAIPRGASGALAGRAANKGVTINFGITLGRHPHGVSVPKAGTGEAYGYPRGGFVYTDDLRVPGRDGKWMLNKRFHTTAEWHHAADINVAIEEKLCRAATGEPCPE